MGYNKFGTDATKKSTSGTAKTGIESNVQNNTDMSQHGTERASEVVVVVD